MSTEGKPPLKDKNFDPEATVALIYPFISPLFAVYEIQRSGTSLFFYGTPKRNPEEIIGLLWEPLESLGLQFDLKYQLGEYVLFVMPKKKKKEKIGLNIALFLATVLTTMFAGATMFGVDLLQEPAQFTKGYPFTLALMAILGSHEMAHFLAARYHGMRTSLPYFIPFPAFIGTLGAVIKYRGPIPSRKALFDVGVAGPLVGLLVSVGVCIIGLSLEAPALAQAPDAYTFSLGLPPLFLLLQNLLGIAKDSIIHPVAFAGWVGMFVTLLNLLPAGQLDGGHILRAMLGKKALKISAVIPFLLLGTGLYVIFGLKEDGFLWIFWGFFLSLFAAAGHPTPLRDREKLDRKRLFLGWLTFFLGLLCFTLVPFRIA
ncbi:MAG: site-2 protease family protein [Methanosarcinaceae archaeon]|nr:site-2 protease family protein [Methanosarcinaceae archaeon]MDD4331002.1 site-2 protease family protein [Methanosarcinaceae archaeon]MDD4748517.1 site-2 protease family protein [Methanosarcinaceae archaeon]